MKKLIWSTFAMSLTISPAWAQLDALEDADDLSALEAEINASGEIPSVPKIQDRPQEEAKLDGDILVEGIDDADEILKFEDSNLSEQIGTDDKAPKFAPIKTDEWKVSLKEMESDTNPYHGQKHSLINWNQDPVDWLNVKRWMNEREQRDLGETWKIRLRDDANLEKVGKVLQCQGKCPLYRGVLSVNAQPLSQVLEGDELQTEKDSVAWVFLMDGTLVRLGPETSMSFQEINIGSQEVFYSVRLNRGHAFWHPRDQRDYPLDDAHETDSVSLPIIVKEANQEFFERKIFKASSEENRVLEFMQPSAGIEQIKALNQQKANHNLLLTQTSRVLLVAPNVSVMSSNQSFDLVAVNGGKAFVKRRSEMGELSLFFRGYSNTQNEQSLGTTWYEIDPQGRIHSALEEAPSALQFIELLTKRIKTFELARELWIAEYTLPILKTLNSPKELAQNFGYLLWEEELKKRQDFLTEYTRRIETTNLRSLDNLLAKIEGAGQTVNRDLSNIYHQHALNHYLKDLQTRYTDKKLQTREMNNLQFYVWILKNGKI